MKKSLLLLTLTCLFFSCSNDDSSTLDELSVQLDETIPSELQPDVIAFYPFNDGSLEDISNSNDLTNSTTASPTWDRNGNADSAYKFNSENEEYLSTPHTDFLDGLSEFSISMWYYANSNGVLVSRDDSYLHCPNTTGQWSLRLFELAQPVFGHMNSVYDPTDDLTQNLDNWHHIVITYNENNNTTHLYRNGVLKQSNTGIADCGDGPPTVLDIGDLFFGKFNGKLDDIALFDKELTVSDVTLLYEAE